MNFKTPYNAVPSAGEVNTQPSKTIPDQSMSIREIMKRYASGLPLGGQRVPMYDEGEDDPFDGKDPRTFDLSEMHDMNAHAKKQLDDFVNEETDKKTRAERRKLKDQIRKEIEDEQKQQSDSSQQKTGDKTPE